MRINQMAAVLSAGLIVGLATSPAAGAQSTCVALGGLVGQDQMCLVRAAGPAYTLDIRFPAEYPDQQSVTDYLTQTRDGFVNVSEMPGSYGLPYVLDAEGTGYRSGAEDAGTRSVVFQVYENVGGPRPQTWYKAFNYDVAKQAPITFDSLFRPGTSPVDVIFPVVQSELEKQTGIDQPVPAGSGLDPGNYQNFALTDDAVIFFFGQGQLLPESAGASSASVPRAVLAPILAV